MAAVHHHRDDHRVQAHERQRAGVGLSSCEQHEQRQNGGRLDALEEQAIDHRGPSRQPSARGRHCHERRAIHRPGGTPRPRDPSGDRVGPVVGRHAFVRALVVVGHDPAVGRVAPDVLRASRRDRHGKHEDDAARGQHRPPVERGVPRFGHKHRSKGDHRRDERKHSRPRQPCRSQEQAARDRTRTPDESGARPAARGVRA